MEKVYIQLTVKLIVAKDSDIDCDTIISELDYHFADGTSKATILDTEITDYEIVDAT